MRLIDPKGRHAEMEEDGFLGLFQLLFLSVDTGKCDGSFLVYYRSAWEFLGEFGIREPARRKRRR